MISRFLTRFPRYVPKSVRNRLKIFAPSYESLLRTVGSREEQVVDTRWGPKIVVDYSQYVERDIAYGDYETEFVDYFSNLVAREFKHFADVGANIGFYSLLFEHLSSTPVTVDAFEPVPLNISRIERNRELNGSDALSIHPIALYDSNTTIQMSVPDNSRGEATLSERSWTDRTTRTISVEQSTLDEFYAGRARKPDLIKVDIEGAEIGLLRGGKTLLAREQPDLLVEIHPPLIDEMGDSIACFKRILTEVGYEKLTDVKDRRTMSLEDGNIASGGVDGRYVHIH